jgi:glycosyltransferase involved in cell wall biosynthesis
VLHAPPYPPIGYILRSYPRLSQTFILNEILALEQLGRRIHIFAVADPQEPITQLQARAVRAPVRYLAGAERRGLATLLGEHLALACAHPGRYLATLAYVLRHKDWDAGYTASSRRTCFLQAVYLARLLRRTASRPAQRIAHLHAHFAHDPTLIALLVHRLTGISYSFTGHARDLYQIPVAALVERIAAADAVVTCCGANLHYLHEVAPQVAPGKARLIPHGVDLREFHPGSDQAPSADLPLILSVGRLVEKKGFPDLVHACGLLKQRGYAFRCVIYGDGPLREELAATIAQLGLAETVLLAGEHPQAALLPVFQQATVFALTPFVTTGGDRDGVPNVLVEAMACGVPVVSTDVAGMPELVQHEVNGLLVPPHDIPAIADALAALLNDEPRRGRMGVAARQTVVAHFDLHAAAEQLAALFDHAGQAAPGAGRAASLGAGNIEKGQL